MSLLMVGFDGQAPETLSYRTIQRLRSRDTFKIARSLDAPGFLWLASEGGVSFDAVLDDIPQPAPAESIQDIVERVLAHAHARDAVYVTPGHPILGENASVQIFTRAQAEGILAGVAGPNGSESATGARDYASLAAVMARLRNPAGGCPWDLEQTHATLRRYLVEEAYEVIEAIDSGESAKLAEELGDLLLQIAFHAQLAREAGTFDNGDVVEHIVLKLIRRHPHVFGQTVVSGSDQVLTNWEQIKRREKGYEDRKSILDGIPRDLPALMRALEISKRVVRVGFEWPSVDEVLDKVDEELLELRQELKAGDTAKAAAELGDLLFTLVNVARQLKVDPEDALRRMTHRFSQRFRRIEKHAEESGRTLSDLSLEEMETVWQQAKREE